MKNINIERNVTINHENRTIEITKQFKAAACRFGTDEYKAIKEAVADHPSYKVVVKKSKRTKDAYKGLTYSFMENYIKKHDDEDQSIMNEFMELRALTDEAKELEMDSFSYLEIKDWFLKRFPEIEKYQLRREAIINKVA